MENSKESRSLLRPQEVAKRMNIGVSTVYHLTHKGLLPGIKIGGSLRFSPDTIDKYLESLEGKSLGSAA